MSEQRPIYTTEEENGEGVEREREGWERRITLQCAWQMPLALVVAVRELLGCRVLVGELERKAGGLQAEAESLREQIVCLKRQLMEGGK